MDDVHAMLLKPHNSLSVPQGYVLVPINPTEEMLAEGCDTLNNEVSWRGKEAESAYPCHLRPVWYAMLAALAAPPQI
jgi:hypothetical protein